MEMQDIVKQLENKIDGLVAKVETERASKADVAELQKSVNTLKATVGQKHEEELDYTSKKINKKVLALWQGEITKSLEGTKFHSAWVKKNPAESLTGIADATGLGMKPTNVDPVISKLIEAWGCARQYCRVKSGVQGTLNVNARTALASFGRTATVVTAPTPAVATFGKIALTPFQSTGISKVADKEVFDAQTNIVQDTAEELSEAAAQAEDVELFQGNSTFFTGLNTIATLGEVSVALAAVTDADGLLNLRANVNTSVIKGGNYFMHPYVFAAYQTKKNATTGLYYFDIASGDWKISGSPIVFSPAMDSSIAAGKYPVMFGSMEQAVTMAIGRDYQLKVLDQIYAPTNEVGFQLTYDFCYGLIQGTALARLKVTAS